MAARAPRKLDYDALLSYALRALGSRGHSAGELRTKLVRRAASPGDVDAVITKLRVDGYLDDRRFAENFAAARVENEGLGRGRVLRDLRTRRVAPAVAESVVNETFRDADEDGMAKAYLQRKLRSRDLVAYLADESHLASAYRRLRYAGFSSGASMRALRAFTHPAQAEVLEDLPDEPEVEN